MQLTYYTSSYEWDLAWHESGVSTNGKWLSVQIELPVGVRLAVIDGTVGSDEGIATVSYIAIDDIRITDEQCNLPSELP